MNAKCSICNHNIPYRYGINVSICDVYGWSLHGDCVPKCVMYVKRDERCCSDSDECETTEIIGE